MPDVPQSQWAGVEPRPVDTNGAQVSTREPPETEKDVCFFLSEKI